MRIFTLLTAFLIAGLFALAAPEAHAQERDLAVLYQLEPEAGIAAEFEEALAEHARWRGEQGDPWVWDVYQVVTGDNLGMYVARAPERAWADLDAYDADFGPRAGAHFSETVGPHLRSNSNMITRARAEEARLPENLAGIQLLSVTIYRVKPGRMMEFWEVVGQIHEAIVQANVPTHYAFHTVVAGGSGPEVHLATLHENWADFEMPDPSVGQALRDAYGEEETTALGERFSETIDSVENMVVRYRPDLSVGR